MRMYVPPWTDTWSRDVTGSYWWSLWDGIRKWHILRDVETYCMFIGYPRSGHSLVGSLLDAHRNAVIAHELDALGYLAAGFGRKQLYSLILAKDREFTENGREWTGYQYQVPNQWQGRHERLKVIGDKKGGLSTIWLEKRPELLDQMRRTVGVPLKLVHVVRNPFDNISTILTRQDRPTLEESIAWYFQMCSTVDRVIQQEQASIITIRHEDVIADAKGCVQQLCALVGVDTDENYVNDCASIVFASPKQTRFSTPWSAEQIRSVHQNMREFEFLKGYAYDTAATAVDTAC